MASEFYEQLGVDRAASSGRIRSAYGQAVSRLTKRRRALVEQGGDSAQLDLQRARLDEAWDVLSDPLRRRRYDALLTWTEGERPYDADGVWKLVAGALVPPAAAVAAKLLRTTSKLAEIGDLPLAPSGAREEPPTLVPHEMDVTNTAARLGTGPLSEPPTATTTPRLAIARPSMDLKVVDGSPGASDVLLLQPRGGPRPEVPAARPGPHGPAGEPAGVRPRFALTSEQVAAIVDEHGYGGNLLRLVRERLHLTLQDVADHTRISVRYLEALEDEMLESLPSATFVRGYVREIARMLQLDADAVASGYMRKLE